MNPQRALDALQAAVWAPHSWPQALDVVADSGDASVVTIVNSACSEDLVVSQRGLSSVDAYLNSREMVDSRDARVNPTLNEGFRTDHDDFDPHEIERDAFYQEFLAPLDVGWHAAAALPGFDHETLVISFKRPPRWGPFERAEVGVLNAMLPQMRWVARQAALVRRARFEGELAAFARIRRGALVLDTSGRILAANDLVVFEDGLRSDGLHLSADAADARAELQRAIASALATGTAPSRPVIVRRPSGKRPYVVDVLSIPAGLITAPRRSCALVVISDPDAVVQPRRDVLCRAFDLTPREADLALLLAASRTLRDAASTLGITENHARQRVKSLLAKTGSANQGDLRALLARLN
jgi:DNA-binding CsgD family transcriptional regulator